VEASMGRRRRPRVIVVEDDARIRDLFCEWLGALGCEAAGAADGEDGVRLFDEGGADTVVTDLMMPGMTGWQVIAALRQRNAALPVIMITGSATNLDPEHLRSSRVLLLEKPVPLVRFQTAVTTALRTRLVPEAPQTSGS
jgi:two-component system OmpR family response regulator